MVELEAQRARPRRVKGGSPRAPVPDRPILPPGPGPPRVSSRPGRVSLPSPGPQRLRLAEVARSFFLFSSLVELKSDRGKSGAGLRPGRSLGLPAPGAIPAGGTRTGARRGGGRSDTSGSDCFVSRKAGEGINCRGGAGEGAGEGRGTPDGSERDPPSHPRRRGVVLLIPFARGS